MKRFIAGIVVMLLLFAICGDWYDGYGNLRYRGLISRLTDAIHQAHGGESHAGRKD
jgi:hypothetical protein